MNNECRLNINNMQNIETSFITAISDNTHTQIEIHSDNSEITVNLSDCMNI